MRFFKHLNLRETRGWWLREGFFNILDRPCCKAEPSKTSEIPAFSRIRPQKKCISPSQDYWHLKQRRADIEAAGYDGLRAPSTRAVPTGTLTVLFHDQSGNVASITPHEVEFQLLQPSAAAFTTHATQELSYRDFQVKVNPSPVISPALSAYTTWQTITINR